MTDEVLNVLQAWVLPWAKERHPDWYEATLKVARNRKSFEAYLIRLAERRWQEEPGDRLDASVMVLEQTGLAIRLKDRKTSEVLEFHGRKVNNRRRAIAELVMDRSDWETLERARKEWDLEYER